MIFNRHSELQGRHALLSPSYYHWLNYDDQKLEARYYSVMSAQRGTDLHDLAHEAIRLGIKLSTSNQALATYVKDAINYRMDCEVPLFYSDNCFGHADTLSFRRRKLRIHDLKNGIAKASVKQLEIYAALFCLEYSIDPYSIEFELRIYQRDEVLVFEPTGEVIDEIMEKIVIMDQRLQQIRASNE